MNDATGVTLTHSCRGYLGLRRSTLPISVQLVTDVNEYSKMSPRTLEYSSEFGTDVARKTAEPPNEQPGVMMQDLDRII